MEPQIPCHLQRQQISEALLPLPTPSAWGTSLSRSLYKFHLSFDINASEVLGLTFLWFSTTRFFFFFLNPCFPSVLDYVRFYSYNRVSLVAQMVKNLSAMQATQVWSLGWEDPLEKEMVTHSSILAWRISWTEEPGGLQSMRSQRVWHDWVTNTYLFL